MAYLDSLAVVAVGPLKNRFMPVTDIGLWETFGASSMSQF
jgi:hypothetical protein